MRDASETLEIAPDLLRLRAANPGPMTGSGTNTYVLIGPQGAVVIDPGPNHAPHLQAIRAAVADCPLRAILITHAHLDHTALTPALTAATSAPVMAFGAAASGRTVRMQALADQGLGSGGEGADLTFAPDDLLVDGQILHIAGLTIDVIHTPGHMGGHLCFGWRDQLFCGDHVMGWSTSLISPPDGDMAAYMASLHRLSRQNWAQFLPGHGDVITSPAARLADLVAHRRAREASILAALRDAPASAATLATQLYTDTPAPLQPAAARNILAHLIDLHDQNRILCEGPITLSARFRAI